MSNNADAVERLYAAAFNRTPDPAGLVYWEATNAAGWSIPMIADYFAHSPEFIADYGTLSDSDFVAHLYLNILGRASDAAGMAYWVADLAIGDTRGNILDGFAQSAENIARTIALNNPPPTLPPVPPTAPPPAPPSAEPPPRSADRTVVLAGSGQTLVDASGNQWTIATNGQISVNGSIDSVTTNVIELAYVDGTIWQENSSLYWWGETQNNDAWAGKPGTQVNPLYPLDPTPSTSGVEVSVALAGGPDPGAMLPAALKPGQQPLGQLSGIAVNHPIEAGFFTTVNDFGSLTVANNATLTTQGGFFNVKSIGIGATSLFSPFVTAPNGVVDVQGGGLGGAVVALNIPSATLVLREATAGGVLDGSVSFNGGGVLEFPNLVFDQVDFIPPLPGSGFGTLDLMSNGHAVYQMAVTQAPQAFVVGTDQTSGWHYLKGIA